MAKRIRKSLENPAFLRLKPYLKALVLALLLIVLLPFVSSARNNGLRVVSKGTVVATAFNSMESQTDSSPWITASGTRCRPGVIASNFLPFGTKVMIEGFGDRVFTVEDRMNKRYKKRVDIWFKKHQDAKNFGVRKVKYYVLAKS